MDPTPGMHVQSKAVVYGQLTPSRKLARSFEPGKLTRARLRRLESGRPPESQEPARRSQSLRPSAKELAAAEEFREFASRVLGGADEFDRRELLPKAIIASIAESGYLGATIAEAYGGSAYDPTMFGLLNEELAKMCSSARTLLTVHSMVAHSIGRWGHEDLKALWLPQLARGEVIGAFCLTEANAGSDIASITTSFRRVGDDILIDGEKRWISFGQVADVFLVFGKLGADPAAVLVERRADGVSITPVTGVLGTRASMPATVAFTECRVPSHSLVGPVGFGLSAVAASALDLGRYSVAWGCVGIAEAALAATLRYASERVQFAQPLRDHQLVQRRITGMACQVRAARLLCLAAAEARTGNGRSALLETCIAKYYAAEACNRVTANAVRIHGAVGCSGNYPIERLFRDAQVMQIIEGTAEMQEMLISAMLFEQ